MASITKQPSGRYRARYRDHAGKEHARHFARKTDAQAWLDTVTASVVRGDYVDARRAKITVDQWAAGWIEGRVHLKPKTLAGYQSLLRTQVLPRWKDVPLAQITHGDVVAWVAQMRKGGLSASRIRQAAGILSMMLADAVRDRRLASNPASEVNLPRHVAKEHRYLTHRELHALATASGNSEALVLVLGYCGLRFGEAAGLRVGNIDLLRRRLRVTEAVTEVNGKHVFGTPKNHQARSVPIPAFLCDRLAVHLKGSARDDLAFPAPRGGVWWNGVFRESVWDRACASVGLGTITKTSGKRRYRGLVPHELRHTAASLAIAAGANIKVVQTMLGHKTATMTWDLYGHLFDDDLDAVAQRLDVAARENLADFSRTPRGPAVIDLEQRRL
jgi:integrase